MLEFLKPRAELINQERFEQYLEEEEDFKVLVDALEKEMDPIGAGTNPGGRSSELGPEGPEEDLDYKKALKKVTDWLDDKSIRATESAIVDAVLTFMESEGKKNPTSSL